jgi:uncharacterized cupredoxin-like copper-binding protein
MNRFDALLVAALIGISFAAGAHQEEGYGKKVSAAVVEQTDWGIAGDAKGVNRTINVIMTDKMRFIPDRFEVRQGETIRFVPKNAGKTMHELVIGTKKALDEHAALMLKFPNMEHDEPYMAHVSPGKRGKIIWTFNRPGVFGFACLIPGHYQAGMKGSIKVAPSARRG